MKKPGSDKNPQKEKKTAESLFYLIYYFAKDWMRPDPNHSALLQIFIFILKLPVLILFLTLSPVIFIVMFITLVVGL